MGGSGRSPGVGVRRACLAAIHRSRGHLIIASLNHVAFGSRNLGVGIGIRGDIGVGGGSGVGGDDVSVGAVGGGRGGSI